MPRLVLASGSPRRRELVESVARDVLVVAADVDESVPRGTPPDVMVRDVALRKASSVAADRPDAVVIGADTTVSLDGEWLGKPADAAEARAMLARLQGREHAVFTGVAVVAARRATTDVTMSVVAVRPLSEGEVAAYVATGEGLDKAGAYGIQGDAGAIVAGVEGCYTNIVGLPLCALALLLARAGVPVDRPPPACGFRSERRCPHPIWGERLNGPSS